MEGAQSTWGNNGVSGDLVEINLFPNEKEREAEEKRKEKEEVESVELGLGLSLNGRFGPDPASKRLRRASSVDGEQARGVLGEGHAPPLVRTCSLPAGAEEWRRQKEVQSLRSMEARRNRMEKMKNVRDGALHEAVNPGVEVMELDSGNGGAVKMWNFMETTAQGSIGSSSGSSAIVESQSQPRMGANPNPLMIGSSSSHQLQQESGARGPDNRREGEVVKDGLLDMPYVTTTGPDMKRIEGFLYRYRKGEEVRIVCVCHGLFMTPAEFVKHGGGGDVAHPLKHIVVNPFPIF